MAPASGIDVVVIDDHRWMREVLCRVLTESGYRVVTTGTATGALAQIAARPPARVLAELRLSGTRDADLLDALRARGLATPVILMSLAHDGQAEAEAHGAAGYLSNPFGVGDLLALVARIVPPRPSQPSVWRIAARRRVMRC